MRLLHCAGLHRAKLPEQSPTQAIQQIASDEAKGSSALSTPLNALKALRAVAFEVIGADIDVDVPLMSAGLDSIAAVEFVNAVATRFGVTLEPTVVFDHPTLDSLATFLSSKLTSNEVTSTRSREEDSTTLQDATRKYLFINPKAKQGIFVWRQKGAASKPVVVFLNGVSGLAAGAEFPRYLPKDVPIISIQAPDLLENFGVESITERAAYYLKLLISELNDHS